MSDDKGVPTRRERWSYHLDQFLAKKHSGFVIVFITTAILMVIGATVYYGVSDDEDMTWRAALFQAWRFIVDSGAHGDEEGIGHVTVGIIWTGFGLVNMSLLIGFITEALQTKAEDMRRGRSKVCESGHFLILGWSDKIYSLIRNFALSVDGCVIVIMADREMEQMNDDIESNIDQDALNGARIVVRNGSPANQMDLERVSPSTAHSIVVLADEAQASLGDTPALMTAMALFGHFEGMLKCHVVVEAILPRSVRLFKQVGGDAIVVLLSQDFTGRLLINCARQRGLAEVYNGLLDFEGTELYLQSFPSLIGLRFGEITQAFDDRCIVVGIHTEPSHATAKRQLSLNPPDDRVYGHGDKLIILAETARSIAPLSSGNRKRVYDDIAKYRLPSWTPGVMAPRHILFLGWRSNMKTLINELDQCVPPNSTVTILCDKAVDKRGRFPTDLWKNVNIEHIHASPLHARQLENALASKPYFNSVLVLANPRPDADRSAMAQSDSQVLVTTMLVKDILNVEAIKRQRSKSSGTSTSTGDESKLERLTSLTERSALPSVAVPSSSPLSSYQNEATDATPLLSMARSSDSYPDLDRDISLTPASSISTSASGDSASCLTRIPHRPLIVSEIADSKTKNLVSSFRPLSSQGSHTESDWVVSNELVAMALTHMAQSISNQVVLAELFDFDGSEVYLKDHRFYVESGRPFTFHQLQMLGRVRKEVVIGYRRGDNPAVLNPLGKRDQRITLSGDDRVIVIAEDQS